jgi:hypothetical protein
MDRFLAYKIPGPMNNTIRRWSLEMSYEGQDCHSNFVLGEANLLGKPDIWVGH